MPRETTKKPVTMKLDLELLDRLDRYQDALPYHTTRTALVEAAIDQMLTAAAKKQPKRA
jgi:predicted transcriptional regulator